MLPESKKRHRIGLFVGEMEHGYSYQGLLWKAALRQAKLLDVDLVLFAGHRIHREHLPIFSHSGVYRMAQADLVEGLILTPPVTGLLDSTECHRLIRDLGNPLAVMVGMELEGVPSVTVDNRSGMKALMDHICTAHRYRNVAYLRGPEGNQEADLRYREFLEGMNRHGNTVNPELVLKGDFTRESGSFALQGFEKTRGHLYMDAIVAANDMMATGALQYLQSRGLAVPEDISVYGFDDIRMSRDCNPPLSTVRQPVALQMDIALQGLVAMLEGRSFDNVVLPTELVLRESCACRVRSTQNSGNATQDAICNSILELIGAPVTHHDTSRFKQDIQNIFALHTPDSDDLIRILATMQDRIPDLDATGLTMAPAQRDILHLRMDVALKQLGNICRFGMYNEVSELYSGTERLNLMIRRFTITDNVSGLQKQLFRELPQAGIDSFYIGYYPAANALAADEASHSFGLNAGKFPTGRSNQSLLIADFPLDFQCIAARIAPHQNLPQGMEIRPSPHAPTGEHLLERWFKSTGPGNLVALPLIAADYCLGVTILSINESNSLYCHGIQDIISTILDRENRLQELIETNMKERISHLAEERKMKSLNKLAVGIAHEINTPVGVGITSGSWLEHMLQESIANSPNGEATGKSLLECIGLINRSFDKVKNLMARFRDMAIDTDDDVMFPMDLMLVARTLAGANSKRFSDKGVGLEVMGPQRLEIQSRADCITQVLASLLDNMMVHAFPGTGGGKATITIQEDRGSAEIQVTDDGTGMTPETIARIFEPYAFMRREGGGMGISMHIAWNLVNYKLKGTIVCESAPGKGTRIQIRIPLKAAPLS